ncbi:zinc finger domain-containing protein [Catenulispora acidiphila]|nr:hypothetical protein [Catenulispora acidiphila]
MAAGIASLAAHERAQQSAARLDADRAAARPAPPEIANRPGRAERQAAESARCPFCKAAPGQHCTAAGQRVMSKPHPGRLDAYAVKAAICPECVAGVGDGCRGPNGLRIDGVHPGRLQSALLGWLP